jgi:hypothetical protein
VSANEALANGRVVELFEAHRLAEAPWSSRCMRVSTRVCATATSGWRFSRSGVSGTSASMVPKRLIRWDHPTRAADHAGRLHPAGRRAGRIDSLTYWVLEEAITPAMTINALGERFQMSVNLSAQMVDKADLVSRFSEIVARRGFDPSLLTIEITETSSVRNRPAACP